MVDSRRTGFNGRRAFYVDEAQALAEADSIARDKQNHGAMAFMELSTEQRKDAGEAIGILSEFNTSLVDSARYYAAYLRAKRGTSPLEMWRIVSTNTSKRNEPIRSKARFQS